MEKKLRKRCVFFVFLRSIFNKLQCFNFYYRKMKRLLMETLILSLHRMSLQMKKILYWNRKNWKKIQITNRSWTILRFISHDLDKKHFGDFIFIKLRICVCRQRMKCLLTSLWLNMVTCRMYQWTWMKMMLKVNLYDFNFLVQRYIS